MYIPIYIQRDIQDLKEHAFGKKALLFLISNTVSKDIKSIEKEWRSTA
jgi:hypothetical protein